MKTLTLGSLLLAATVASVLLVTGVPQLKNQSEPQGQAQSQSLTQPAASTQLEPQTLQVMVGTTSGVTRGGLSVELAVSMPDARNQLLVSTTDLRGVASFDLRALTNEAKVTAFVRDGDRCAISTTHALTSGVLSVQLPTEQETPLRLRCVDPEGRELQPATMEVVEAQHLAPHGVQHARLWSTTNTEDGPCPIVFPTGTLRVAATLPQGMHPGLRTHAIAEVTPGSTEAVLVFGRKSQAASRGTVDLHCQGVDPTAQVHIVSHGLSQRDARLHLQNGRVELQGLSVGANDLCVRTSDGHATMTTVEVQANGITKVECELQPSSTLELQAPASNQAVDWQVLACTADGVATVALEQGSLAPGETHTTIAGLPATSVLIVWSAGERSVVRANLEAGATTSVPLHTPSVGTELTIAWPEHLTVRTLTFALASLHHAHAGTQHSAVLSWHSSIPADTHVHSLGTVPPGVYDIVAYPDAGTGTPVARLRAEVQGSALRVDLAN